MGIGLLVGLLWMGCSLLLFATRKKNQNRYYKLYVLFFAVSGGIGIMGFILSHVKMELTALFLPTAILCIFSFVYMKRQMEQCSVVVKATYIQYHTYYAGKGRTIYNPVFQYIYNNKTYKGQTLDSCPLRILLKNYTKGQSYDIFVNADKPEYCFSRKKISILSYMVGLLGIVTILGYLFLIFCANII